MSNYQNQLKQIDTVRNSSNIVNSDQHLSNVKMANNNQPSSIKSNPIIIAKKAVTSLAGVGSNKPVTSGYQPLGPRIKLSTTGRKYVIVIKGDTLFNLAVRSNNSSENLKTLNKMTDNNVKLGQIIYLD